MKQIHLPHAVMECIDPDLVEEADIPQKRKIVRFRPALLAAACLILLLIGTAVAAGSSEAFPAFISYFRAKPHPTRSGYTSDGWEISITGDKIPLAEFSEAAQTQPTGYSLNSTMTSLDSWEDAEEFVGRDLMDNPVLEGAEMRARFGFNDENGEFVHCNVLLTRSWTEGELSRVGLNTSYDVTLSEDAPTTCIHLSAAFFTEASLLATSGWKHYTTVGVEFAPSTYTTPSGLTAAILQVTQAESAHSEYHAYFTYNGGVWHLAAACSEEDARLAEELGEYRQAYLTLKQILDEFR